MGHPTPSDHHILDVFFAARIIVGTLVSSCSFLLFHVEYTVRPVTGGLDHNALEAGPAPTSALVENAPSVTPFCHMNGPSHNTRRDVSSCDERIAQKRHCRPAHYPHSYHPDLIMWPHVILFYTLYCHPVSYGVIVSVCTGVPVKRPFSKHTFQTRPTKHAKG